LVFPLPPGNFAADVLAWIRHFTTIISSWWLRTSGEVPEKKLKKQPENLEIGNLWPKRVMIRPKYSPAITFL